MLLNLLLVRLGYPPAIVFKNERTKYLNAMRKADNGDYGPFGEVIARAVTNNLDKFVVPAVAGSARLEPPGKRVGEVFDAPLNRPCSPVCPGLSAD